MRAIRSFPSAALADAAARYLRANGVHAQVAGRVGGSGIMGATGHGAYDVLLIDRTQANVAEALLQERSEEAKIDDAELEAQAHPDLSRLSPRHRPRCPGCGVVVEAQRRPERCAGCDLLIDVEALIVDQHGPEVLAVCYLEQPEDIPESLIDTAELNCPVCQYALENLPADGICPECGTRYSKAELLQRRAGPL